MATEFTISIPNGLASELINAFATNFNYPENIPNPEYDSEDPESPKTIPNPENKTSFAKGHIKRYIRDVYRTYKIKSAISDTRESVLEQADTDTNEITVE